MSGSSALVLNILNEIDHMGAVGQYQLEVYTGGGLPPPHYRSDQFRAYRFESREILEFNQIFWDQRYTPSELHRVYRLPATPSDVRELVRLIRGARVFETTYPEETSSGRADVLRYEVCVITPDTTIQRTYHQTVPDAVTPLYDRVHQQITRLEREGEHSITHQGHPIQYQPPQ